MAAQSPLAVTLSLASAINRQVLTVLPETSIAEVIRQMSAVEGEACTTATNSTSANSTSTDKSDLTATYDNPTSRFNHGFVDESIHDAMTWPSNQRASCAVVVAPAENHLTNAPHQIMPHRVIGILTERDIVRLTATQSTQSVDRQLLENTPVSALMTTPVKTMEESDFQDIFAALFLFRRYRIRHLPIVDSHNQLIGVVTPASIRQVLRPANLLKMHRVGDVMSTEVVQAPASVSVLFLAQVMAEKQVSCVVIVDTTVAADRIRDDALPPWPPVGIVTERDIVQFQSLGLSLESTRASAVMSTPLFLLDPQDSLWAAHEAMKAHRVRRLVVSWNWGRGLGIITQTSMLRVFDPIEMYGIIDNLQHTIRQLQEEKQPKEAPVATASSPRSGAETVIAEAMGQPNPPKTQAHQAQVDSGDARSMISAAATDGCLLTLLDRAADCITAARQPQLTSAQQQQLHQATQLIQQIKSAYAIEQGNAAQCNSAGMTS